MNSWPMIGGVMPSRIRGWMARKAAIVMSAAACISASSAGDLIIRSARTTGLALTMRRCRQAAACSRSMMKKRLVSSKPTGCAGDAALPEEIRDQLQRLLILLPGADFGRDLEALLDRRLFEEGRDDDRIALRRG